LSALLGKRRICGQKTAVADGKAGLFAPKAVKNALKKELRRVVFLP
jgi:hypothetical protein